MDSMKVVEIYDAHEKKEAELSRALVPFSDNLPYSAERLAQEVMMLYRMRTVLKFEVGRRLIVMWERERGPECPNFGHFVKKFFPDVPKQRAYEDMRYARLAADCPLFRNYAEAKGNWSKALALMEVVGPEELAEFEAKEEILGISRDALDRMSIRELKNCIRRLKQEKAKAVEKATATLVEEKKRLMEKVGALEAAQTGPELAAAEKLLQQADKKILEAMQCLRKIPRAALREGTIRDAVLGKCNHLMRLVETMEREALEAVVSTGEV